MTGHARTIIVSSRERSKSVHTDQEMAMSTFDNAVSREDHFVLLARITHVLACQV